MAKISVIIPVYNAAKYIEQCLKSVLVQTLEDIEIICINDNSKDDSLKIVENFAKEDARFVLMNNTQNKKQGYCRNLGIKTAKAPYICFLDADDYFANENFLQDAYSKMVENDLDLYIFNNFEFHQNENSLIQDEKEKLFPFIYNQDYCGKVIICENPILSGMPWDKIYKKEFLINNNIAFAQGVYFEDIAFNFLVGIYAKKILAEDKKHIVYRLNAETSTTTNILNVYKDSIKMFEILKESLDNRNIFEKYRTKYILTIISALHNDILMRVKKVSYFHYLSFKKDIKTLIKNLCISDDEFLDICKDYPKSFIKNILNFNPFKEIVKDILKTVFSVTKSCDNKYKIITLFGSKITCGRKNA